MEVIFSNNGTMLYSMALDLKNQPKPTMASSKAAFSTGHFPMLWAMRWEDLNGDLKGKNLEDSCPGTPQSTPLRTPPHHTHTPPYTKKLPLSILHSN
jgi:hypothetical protein